MVTKNFRSNLHSTSAMLKRTLILAILFLPLLEVFGTHIRGGYISAKRIEGYKYEFLLTIYRDATAETTNPINDLYPDKNSTDKLSSNNIVPVISIPGKRTEIWQYKFTYTYRSPGVYTAYHYQLNRNTNVLNMDNSLNTTFYVETKVIIDPFLDLDQSPVIAKAAVDFASIGSVYRYNPGASDPDGDSLSYKLVPSRQFLPGQDVSVEVTNYRDPAVRSGGLDSANSSPATLVLNELTGELTWNSPRLVGEFNTAIKIIQWRKLRADRPKRDSIGFVLLDIQIIVTDSRNKPPVLFVPRDTCVVAGAFIDARIVARDPDQNQVIMSLIGELDTIFPKSKRARFIQNPGSTSPFSGQFEWQTNCSHVRTQPYYAVFQAEDIPSIPSPLVDIKIWKIKVIGPPPQLKRATPETNGKLRISWNPYVCKNASKIFIYRKIDSSMLVLDTCRPGMPPGYGFVKIGEVDAKDTSFVDDNSGKGLKKGPAYCYRIVAVFPQPAGGESLVSNEVCATLELDIPLIVNVDIAKTGINNGEILVRWTQPFYIDTVTLKKPFKVQIFRNSGNEPKILVKTTEDLKDTTLLDVGLDTRNKIYNYSLRFVFGELENTVDSSEKASSVRLDLSPGVKKITLKWNAKTPWTNDGKQHLVYREINNAFVLIDSVQGFGGEYQYVDEGKFNNTPLEDSVLYCYFVRTRGTYSNPLVRTPLVNASQFLCAYPNDTIKPCPPPDFSLDTLECQVCKSAPNCKNCTFLNNTEFSRKLTWRAVYQEDCGVDIANFNVYYAEHLDDPLVKIASVNDTFFLHTSLTTLAGCYAITSVDRSGNESSVANRTCVDNCIVFDLPNTIIPNGDKFNEKFTPTCFSRAFIESVNFSVYNRWGQKIFEEDVPPEINWLGITENNSTIVVPGVYFYLAKVKTKRLNKDDEDMIYKGWIFIAK